MVGAIASDQKTGEIANGRNQEFVSLCLLACLLACLLLLEIVPVCLFVPFCFFLFVSYFVSLFFGYLCPEKCQIINEAFGNYQPFDCSGRRKNKFPCVC